MSSAKLNVVKGLRSTIVASFKPPSGLRWIVKPGAALDAGQLVLDGSRRIEEQSANTRFDRDDEGRASALGRCNVGDWAGKSLEESSGEKHEMAMKESRISRLEPKQSSAR